MITGTALMTTNDRPCSAAMPATSAGRSRGHPQQVSAISHRLPGYRGHVDRPGPAEEKHLGAKSFGLALEVELHDLSVRTSGR